MKNLLIICSCLLLCYGNLSAKEKTEQNKIPEQTAREYWVSLMDKICYPVISFTEEPHEGSARALTGGDALLRKELSAERLVAPDYPETYCPSQCESLARFW